MPAFPPRSKSKRIGLDGAGGRSRSSAIGDNWRLRYHGLKLHNKTPVNHLRYLPFPPTWPDYIPKDKIANWLEAMSTSWRSTSGPAPRSTAPTTTSDAALDRAARRGDGTVRTLRPKHIVHRDQRQRHAEHSRDRRHREFRRQGAAFQPVRRRQRSGRARPVVVFGTGTSAHDICQELQASGADVTMVQRSPTLVVNVEPSAQLYDRIYLGDGPPIEVRDILNPRPAAGDEGGAQDRHRRGEASSTRRCCRGWSGPVSGSNSARTAPAGR